MSWKVLNDGKIGVFGLEEVELPNGRRMTMELLRHPGAAAVVPFLDTGAGRPDSDPSLLLLHQYRHAVGGYLWEVPAGKLDPGEAPEVCAARELEEETGYRPGKIERLGEIVTAPGFSDEVIHLFRADELTVGRLEQGPGEVMEVHEVRLSEALAMIGRGEITDAKTIIALTMVTQKGWQAGP